MGIELSQLYYDMHACLSFDGYYCLIDVLRFSTSKLWASIHTNRIRVTKQVTRHTRRHTCRMRQRNMKWITNTQQNYIKKINRS